MTIDLRTCKPGDKLISKHGLVLTYVGPRTAGDYYDHDVSYPDGSKGSRIHSGHVYRNPSMRLEADHDIVNIIPAKKPKVRIYKYGDVRYTAAHKATPDHFSTCGTCGRSWDDTKSTSLTPTPSGRCPFEYFKNHSTPA